MKARTRLWVLAAVPLVIGGAGTLFWLGTIPPDPMHQGKRLSEWLRLYGTASRVDSKPADEAVRTIGTNGIPLLLRMLRARDTRLEVAWMRLLSKQPFVTFGFQPAHELYSEAETAFMELGPAAAGAVPELIRIYEQEISEGSRHAAASALAYIGTAAEPALPALIRNFDHKDSETRRDAVWAACRIGRGAEVLVPALRGSLQDAEPWIRWYALNALMHFRDQARAVLPELLKLRQDHAAVGGSTISQQVERALWSIAPEHCKGAVLVCGAEALVQNGATAGELLVEHGGKRLRVISAGKKVPVANLFWGEFPEAPFKLYRRARGGGSEEYLGEFQLQGRATSDWKRQVYIMCVVTGQEIFLSARDYLEQVPVPVRRKED